MSATTAADIYRRFEIARAEGRPLGVWEWELRELQLDASMVLGVRPIVMDRPPKPVNKGVGQ